MVHLNTLDKKLTTLTANTLFSLALTAWKTLEKFKRANLCPEILQTAEVGVKFSNEVISKNYSNSDLSRLYDFCLI